MKRQATAENLFQDQRKDPAAGSRAEGREEQESAEGEEDYRFSCDWDS